LAAVAMKIAMRRRDFIVLLCGATALHQVSLVANLKTAKASASPFRTNEFSRSERGHLEGLRRGLQDLGYTEGQNVWLEYRSAKGEAARFSALAAKV
jgi:hypothetical protein